MSAERFKIWQDDYRREVEAVMEELQTQGPEAVFGRELRPVDSTAEGVELRRQLEATRQALETRVAELAEESRRRESLKDLAVKLNWAVQSLDAELKDARLRIEELEAKLARRK
jgi:hypothetical protein